MARIPLTLQALLDEAQRFGEIESQHDEPALYGVTDGKAVGTYLEQKFHSYLQQRFEYSPGSSAKGKDFPDLEIDMKVTSIAQPQSSSPFRSARQKIYGLGYSLLVFVYEKTDDHNQRTGRLAIAHTVYIDALRTGDFQTSSGLLKIIENEGNVDDVMAFLQERSLPVDDIQARDLAEEVLANPPPIGYLTISNALQWRLQYSRVITVAGEVDGIQRVR